jgi:integrase/recombinase XerD
MSILRQRAENYVAMRRTLGFTMDTQAQLLNSFVGYAEQAGATTVTTDLAVAWARLPVTAQPIRWNHRLATVRDSPFTYAPSTRPPKSPQPTCCPPGRTGSRPTCTPRARSPR